MKHDVLNECSGRGSNPHDLLGSRDFKSLTARGKETEAPSNVVAPVRDCPAKSSESATTSATTLRKNSPLPVPVSLSVAGGGR